MTSQQKHYQREITRIITEASKVLSREDAITLLCNMMQTGAVVVAMLNDGHGNDKADV